MPFSPTNDQLGQLSPEGVNPLVLVPQVGPVAWGARTSAMGGPYRYLTTERTTDLIERSLPAGLAWTVFEPNGPQLWSQVESSVTTFLQTMSDAGELGSVTDNGVQVVVDETTTTPQDIAAGHVVGSIALDYGIDGTVTLPIEATAGT